MSIRNSVKAVLIKGEKVLLTKNQDQEGYFYLYPGGGQEHSETLPAALQRECMEETGYEIEVGELLHIREYIGKNHEHSTFDFDVHQVEYYFRCEIKNDHNAPAVPTNPDSHQVGTEWVPVEDLLQYRLYPRNLRKYVMKHSKGEKALVYLGDIN